MTLVTAIAAILFVFIAVALVAFNRALQRLARPDKGDRPIAGCCGMALPEEILRSDLGLNQAATERVDLRGSIRSARDTGATPKRESPAITKSSNGSGEEYHEL